MTNFPSFKAEVLYFTKMLWSLKSFNTCKIFQHQPIKETCVIVKEGEGIVEMHDSLWCYAEIKEIIDGIHLIFNH